MGRIDVQVLNDMDSKLYKSGQTPIDMFGKEYKDKYKYYYEDFPDHVTYKHFWAIIPSFRVGIGAAPPCISWVLRSKTDSVHHFVTELPSKEEVRVGFFGSSK